MRTSLSTSVMVAGAILLGMPNRPAFSWGNEGHQLIGDIAEAALAQNPKVMQHFHQVFGAPAHLRDITTCMDRIRDFVRGGGKFPLDPQCAPFIAKFATPAELLTRFPHSDKWHFINIPVDGNPHTNADVRSFCGAELCAPDRIEHYQGTLDANAPIAVQAEAILVLAHLVGDVHQPLHSAERNNDLGGNLLIVTVFGHVFNLHHTWDDETIARMTDGHGTTLPDEAARSHRLVASLPAPGAFKPWKWALDAFHLAATVAYVNFGAAPAGSTIPDVRTPPGTTLHDAEYLHAADPATQKQLRLAGVRLAAILRDKLNQ